MIRSVFLAPRAEADLDRLAEWIAGNGSPLTALQYVGRIRRFLSGFGQYPERGMDYGWFRPGLRVVGFERRVVVAIVVREKHVEIERVFYGGQDWKRALRLPDD